METIGSSTVLATLVAPGRTSMNHKTNVGLGFIGFGLSRSNARNHGRVLLNNAFQLWAKLWGSLLGRCAGRFEGLCVKFRARLDSKKGSETAETQKIEQK